MFPCLILVLAGVKSSWSQCALSLPLNQDLGWSLWLQGFSLSLWLRLEHAGSCTTPGLTRKASFSTASESSSASDWGVICDAWTTREHGKYTKCLGTAGHCTMASCCVICKFYNNYKLIQCSRFLSINGLKVFTHFSCSDLCTGSLFGTSCCMYTNLLTPCSTFLLEKLASSQEIPCILWNPKVHYCIYKCLSLT